MSHLSQIAILRKFRIFFQETKNFQKLFNFLYVLSYRSLRLFNRAIFSLLQCIWNPGIDSIFSFYQTRIFPLQSSCQFVLSIYTSRKILGMESHPIIIPAIDPFYPFEFCSVKWKSSDVWKWIVFLRMNTFFLESSKLMKFEFSRCLIYTIQVLLIRVMLFYKLLYVGEKIYEKSILFISNFDF